MNRTPWKGSLRQRLALTLGALGAASALLLGLLFWASESLIEQRSLGRLMQRELDLLTGRGGLGAAEVQQLFRPAHGVPAPPGWETFPDRTYQRVQLNGENYQLLVRELEPGDKVYLIQSLAIEEQRELWLLSAIVFCVLLSALAAFAVSGRLSRLALDPLQKLLQWVRSLRPGERGQRLQAAPESPELDVVIHALNEYNEALDRVVAHERAFAGAAAHELHTPLSVVITSAELLQARFQAEPVVARIQRAGVQAAQTLDLLLSLSGAREAATPRLLDLREELPRILQQCSPAPGVRIEQELAGAVSLRASVGAVDLVLLNLVRNALRAARSRVTVTATAGCVEVRDDGPGIEPGLLQHVFEPGVRGQDGGTGFGLYIAQAVARQQGWTLSLENAPDGGAVARWSWAEIRAGA